MIVGWGPFAVSCVRERTTTDDHERCRSPNDGGTAFRSRSFRERPRRPLVHLVHTGTYLHVIPAMDEHGAQFAATGILGPSPAISGDGVTAAVSTAVTIEVESPLT